MSLVGGVCWEIGWGVKQRVINSVTILRAIQFRHFFFGLLICVVGYWSCVLVDSVTTLIDMLNMNSIAHLVVPAEESCEKLAYVTSLGLFSVLIDSVHV